MGSGDQKAVNEIGTSLRVIVVAYGNSCMVLHLLRSLEEQLAVPSEVIVWDNSEASQPDLAGFHSERFRYRYVSDGSNIGFARGANAAARLETGFRWTALLLLNPDSILDSAITPKLMGELVATKAIAGLRVFDDPEKTRRQANARRFPRLVTFLSHRDGPLTHIWPSNPWSRAYLGLDLSDDRVQEVDWVSGCALFVSREPWDRLGGFDERYFLYVEDVDLGRKARETGVPVLYFPKVDVVHQARSSSELRSGFADYHHHRGMFLYFWKWASPPSRLLAPFVFLLVTFRFLWRRVRSLR